MTEDEAIQIATEYVADSWGRRPQLIGAQPPPAKHLEWSVLFKSFLPSEPDDVVVDGPTVVLVDPQSRAARFLASL